MSKWECIYVRLPVQDGGRERQFFLCFAPCGYILSKFVTTAAIMWTQSVVVSLVLLSGAGAVAVDAPFSNYQTKINA